MEVNKEKLLKEVARNKFLAGMTDKPQFMKESFEMGAMPREEAAAPVQNEAGGYVKDGARYNEKGEQIDFYPEKKEMSYQNILEVKNNLKDINKLFVDMNGVIDKDRFKSFVDMWRKLESSISILDKNLNLE
jgi:hypothetical protein